MHFDMNEEIQGKDKNAAEQNLAQQFRKLGEKESSPPDDLQDEVFNSLDTLNLFGDFLDLFTAKFAATNIDMVEAIGEQKESDTANANDNESDNE